MFVEEQDAPYAYQRLVDCLGEGWATTAVKPCRPLPFGDSQHFTAGRVSILLGGEENLGQEVWPLQLTFLLPLGRHDFLGSKGLVLSVQSWFLLRADDE